METQFPFRAHPAKAGFAEPFQYVNYVLLKTAIPRYEIEWSWQNELETKGTNIGAEILFFAASLIGWSAEEAETFPIG